ncbi:MarR family protein [Peptococcaceae bacterium CEB3]|nr:MarR family protein [Peptococcaceae bacterium CEB3]
MSDAENIRKELRLLIRELGLLNHNCLNSGMTLTQTHVLSYLRQNGITSFTELQIQLDIDKASLSRILKGFAQKQLLSFGSDDSDKRVKSIVISPLGITAIEMAENKANSYITSMLKQNHEALSTSVIDSLKKLRISALRNTLLLNKQRLILQPLPNNYQKSAIELLLRVFCSEQNIPSELIPIEDNLHPLWWCARVGEDILGVVVSWMDNSAWHWGRFAVERGVRGLGIGKQLATHSLQDAFSQGAHEIFIEARDATVYIIGSLGGRVIGDPIDFFGEPVTPMLLERDAFRQDLPSTCESLSVSPSE